MINKQLDWTSAGQQCRSLHEDAHLLIINDAQEQWSVAEMIESIRRKCPFHIFVILVSPSRQLGLSVCSVFFSVGYAVIWVDAAKFQTEVHLFLKVHGLLLQTLDLENFATAYRSSKRVINLVRERQTLRP